jgi:hypothetical protein
MAIILSGGDLSTREIEALQKATYSIELTGLRVILNIFLKK